MGSKRSAKGAQHPPLFDPCLLWPLSPISATAELVWSSAGCANRRVTDRKASFATQFMYTKFDNNRSRLCHGNDGPVVNLHACHRNIASGWHQSLHAQHTHIQLVDADSEANTEPSKMTTTQLTELHANSSFFKRCLVSLSGGSLIR